jgi:hypothetical protein
MASFSSVVDTRDLQLASKSWYERAKSAGMASVALSTVGTIVPLPSFEGTADWVGGITGAAGVGVAACTAATHLRSSPFALSYSIPCRSLGPPLSQLQTLAANAPKTRSDVSAPA